MNDQLQQSDEHERAVPAILSGLRSLLEGDMVSVIVLTVLLLFIGGHVSVRDAVARIWGQRLSLLAFIVYAVVSIVVDGIVDAGTLLTTAFQGLIVAGLTLGTSWIVLPVAWFVLCRCRATSSRFIGGPIKAVRTWLAELRKRPRNRRETRDERRERKRTEIRQRRTEQEKTEATKRRTEARAALELEFRLHAPELGKRFTKRMLDEYVKKYLSDADAPDAVERRAMDLTTALRAMAAQANGGTAHQSLSDLTTWYAERLAQIDDLPVHDSIKQMHRVDLQIRYADRASELLNHP